MIADTSLKFIDGQEKSVNYMFWKEWSEKTPKHATDFREQSQKSRMIAHPIILSTKKIIN